MGIFERWQITTEELESIVDGNPSLRGMMFGYVSEYMLRKVWFSDPRFQDVRKEDDHDRTQKGDLWFTYKGTRVSIEVKALQTHSVRGMGGAFTGEFQCDASDRREVQLPNGERLQTTSLLVGEFDMLAVCLFAFGNQWRFAFAKNWDLPRPGVRSKKTAIQKEHLLASTMKISWPLQPPYEAEPFRLLDEIVREKQAGIPAKILEGVTITPSTAPKEPPRSSEDLP